MNFKALVLITCSFFCELSFAELWSIHISEDTIETTHIPATNRSDVFYVNKNSTRELNPSNNITDAHILGDSIEFEVFEISETRSSHTIFESGGGICNGYNSKGGVYITDSTTYYIAPENKKEYYKNIAIGTVSARGKTKNIQYVPVFYIQDPTLAETIQKEDSKQGKEIASRNILNRSQLLSQVICKPAS